MVIWLINQTISYYFLIYIKEHFDDTLILYCLIEMYNHNVIIHYIILIVKIVW